MIPVGIEIKTVPQRLMNAKLQIGERGERGDRGIAVACFQSSGNEFIASLQEFWKTIVLLNGHHDSF